MKKLILLFFTFFFFSYFTEIFAFDLVSSPTSEQKWFENDFSMQNLWPNSSCFTDTINTTIQYKFRWVLLHQKTACFLVPMFHYDVKWLYWNPIYRKIKDNISLLWITYRYQSDYYTTSKGILYFIFDELNNQVLYSFNPWIIPILDDKNNIFIFENNQMNYYSFNIDFTWINLISSKPYLSWFSFNPFYVSTYPFYWKLWTWTWTSVNWVYFQNWPSWWMTFIDENNTFFWWLFSYQVAFWLPNINIWTSPHFVVPYLNQAWRNTLLMYFDKNNNYTWTWSYSFLPFLDNTYFDNPNLYLRTLNTDLNITSYRYYKWNLNCLTPWYTSTKLDISDNKYYCASDDLTTFQEPRIFAEQLVEFATCTDWIKNQDETSVDYGWVCWTCLDLIQNWNETSVDFWWRCWTCTDWIKNANETNIDIWGRCDTSSQYCYNSIVDWTETTDYLKDWFYWWDTIDSSYPNINYFTLWTENSWLFDDKTKFKAEIKRYETLTGSYLWDTWRWIWTTSIEWASWVDSWFFDTYLDISLLSPTLNSSWWLLNSSFNYIRIDWNSTWNFKIKWKSYWWGFEESLDYEMSWNYKFNEYIKLDYRSSNIQIIFEDWKKYNITNIDVWTWTTTWWTTQLVCETTDINQNELNDILSDTWTSLWEEALDISNQVWEITKEELDKINEEFATDNPFLKKIFDYIKRITDALWLRPFFDFLNMTVSSTPNLWFNLPLPTLNNKAELWIQLFETELIPIYDPYSKVKILPSTYWPYIISIISVILYFSFYSSVIYLLFLFSTKVLNYIDTIATSLLWKSTINTWNNWNIWTFIFAFPFWAFMIKNFLVFYTFISLLLPVINLTRDLLLVFISWITSSFWWYANFVMITNTIIYSIIIWVVLYIIMHLANRFWKLN